jgi:hypothetical protein
MTEQHDLGISQVVAHGVHVGSVRYDVDLLAINGQAAAAVTTVVKMGDRKQLS